MFFLYVSCDMQKNNKSNLNWSECYQKVAVFSCTKANKMSHYWTKKSVLRWPLKTRMSRRYIIVYCCELTWRHVSRRTYLSGERSSWVHICATKYQQLVTTCKYANLSWKNIWEFVFFCPSSLFILLVSS